MTKPDSVCNDATIKFAEQNIEILRADCVTSLRQMELDGIAIRNIYDCITGEKNRIAELKEAEQQ